MLNQIKTFLVMAVLAAASYGVYMLIWQKPSSTTTSTTENSQETPSAGSASSTTLLAGAPAASNPPGAFVPPETTPGVEAPTALNPSARGPSPGASFPTPPAAVPLNGTPPSIAAVPALDAGENARTTSALPAKLTGTAAPGEAHHEPLPAETQPGGEGSFQDRYADFMREVWKTLDAGRLADAHLALSKLYERPDLPETQRRQVIELLDQLAGTVLYSRQHLLEPPYVVHPGETIEQIAERYNVPPILLARINGMGEKEPPAPGRQLKVLRGPFQAVVSLERHELTLMVQGRYAGRFALGVGVDCTKLEGEYTVLQKIADPAYRHPDGGNIPPGDAHNPLGKYWIGLSDQIGLHGTNDPQNIGHDNCRGTLCFGDRDIDDLNGILSVGSRVVIQR
jgi:hypothetical protein